MNSVPNSLKRMLWKGDIVALTDTFKIILMKSGFVFNKDTHHCYADVITSELSTEFGYTTGGKTLTGIALTVNDILDRSELKWDDAQWMATGGSLVASGAIIYDDTTDTVSGHDYTAAIISYKNADGILIATDGSPLIIKDIMEVLE